MAIHAYMHGRSLSYARFLYSNAGFEDHRTELKIYQIAPHVLRSESYLKRIVNNAGSLSLKRGTKDCPVLQPHSDFRSHIFETKQNY